MLLSRLALGTLLLVAGCQPPTSPQSAPALLTRRLLKAQVLADLTLFQRVKESAHAGIYKYRTKAQMDSAFAAARAQVTDQMTVVDVYKLVVAVTDFEGSLHNDTFLPRALLKEVAAQPVFFPYPLKEIAGQVVLNTAHAPIPLGAVVLSVNGIGARRLVRELGKYYTTDGFNQTGKRIGFASAFPQYYRLEYGPAPRFVVRYTRPARPADTLTQTLPAVTYPVYQAAFEARHSKPSDEVYFDEPPHKYTFERRPDQATAVLTVNTFGLGEDSTAGHKKYAAFLDSCFRLLRRSPAITNLLVDVRANGGGDDDNDMLTFSYLASAPFRENKGSTVNFRRVPYRRYLSFEKDTSERTTRAQEFERELGTDFTGGPDGKLHENAKGNPVFQPQPARFRGRLYLLISPRIASAGSMFTAMVRGNTRAVLIGEETMGGYYGHTGHGPLEYTLPNTQIQTVFFRVDLQQDVPARATQLPGRGIMPDYPVTQSYADFMANRDTQLAFARQLMADKTGSAQ